MLTDEYRELLCKENAWLKHRRFHGITPELTLFSFSLTFHTQDSNSACASVDETSLNLSHCVIMKLIIGIFLDKNPPVKVVGFIKHTAKPIKINHRGNYQGDHRLTIDDLQSARLVLPKSKSHHTLTSTQSSPANSHIQ